MLVVNAMIKIIAALGLGFLLRRIKLLDSAATSAMSKLTLEAACPCMIFSSIVGMDSENKSDVGTLMIIGVLIYIILAIFGIIISKLISNGSKPLFCMFLSLILFGNVGFMGFPLAESFFGDLGVSYMGLLNIHFTVLMFTLGLYLCQKSAGKSEKFNLLKMINTSTIGIVLSVLIFFLNIEVPEIIMQPIDFIGQLMSPLALIITGSTIASYPFAKMFGNWRYYVIAASRLVVIPAVLFFVLKPFFGAGAATQVSVMSVGVPPASTITMMAVAYEGDHETSSLTCGLCTILSIGTVPLLYLFMNAMA